MNAEKLFFWKKLFILFFLQVTLVSVAQSKNGSPFQTAKTFTADKNARITESYEISNMPRIRSQGSFGLCYGFAAAVVAQRYICKVEEIQNCTNPGPEFEISPLSMAAWANTNSIDDTPGFRVHHTNIRLDSVGGANATLALINSAKIFEFKPEACYKFDKIAKRYGEKELVDQLIVKYKKLYHEKNVEGCDNCLIRLTQDLNDDLELGISVEGVKSALKEGTFAEFFYKLVFRNECKGIRFAPKPNARIFPRIGEYATAADMLSKAKEVLAAGNPLLLNGFCIDGYSEDGRCKGGHHLVLSGYKEICKTPSNCKRLFKVQNSWGEDWQKAADDGWLVAEELINHIGPDPTRPGFPIAPGSLGWLE